MAKKRNRQIRNRWRLLNLSALGLFLITGVVCGVVITAFKEGINFVARLMQAFLAQASGTWTGRALFLGAFLVFASIIYLCNQKDEHIKGSGIPVIYGLLDKKFKVNWKKTLPLKFFTSMATVGSGLTLGREGPSVQIGGLVGQMVHHLSGTKENIRYFVGSSAGAGLAVAFNAPMAGVLFTVEEIYKKTDRKVFLSTAVTVFSAIMVSNLLVGNSPALEKIPLLKAEGPSMYGYYALLGILTGLSGVLFNGMVIGGKRRAPSIPLPDYLKFILPFLATALVLLMDSRLFGSGEPFILLPLGDNVSIGTLAYFYVAKLFLLTIIFAVGTPGGSLVPLLVLGSLLGNLYASILASLGLISPDLILVFSMLAMCGHFSAIVRTPITAILLILEMTGGAFEYLLALAVVSLLSYTVAELLRSKPFYDHLYEYMVEE